MSGSRKLIRILVVDDSKMARSLLVKQLDAEPDFEVVGAARDGVEALRRIAVSRPDVVTLDLEMPRMDGMRVLSKSCGRLPVNFVVVSTLTKTGGRAAMEALSRGAFDYVTKPAASGATREEFARELVAKIRAAARGGQKLPRTAHTDAPIQFSAPLDPGARMAARLVAIGTSCGGPQTLHKLLPQFASNFVPIVITQHMPAEFTGPLATTLNGPCPMTVVEAEHRMPLETGHIYIAPGSHHLRVARSGTQLIAHLDSGPAVSGHRPSVDVMFDHLAGSLGRDAVGVILTGMGRDGAIGLKKMRQAGAMTIGQDEASSVVYGMPKAAADAGAVQSVVTLDKMAAAIYGAVAGKSSGRAAGTLAKASATSSR